MAVWVQVVGRVRPGLLVGAAILLSLKVVGAAPAAPTLYAPTVAGPQVTLSWSAVAGATGYRLAIALTPGGAEAFAQIVGPQAAVTFTSPFVGANSGIGCVRS